MVFGGKGVVNSEKDRESHGQIMCGIKLMNRKKTDELMDMLG